MEDVRVWWELAVQWALWAWQWLLAWPWGEWLGVVQAVLGRDWLALGTSFIGLYAFLSSSDGWDILGNVATVFSTLWLVLLGRESMTPGRWTILAGLYEHMEVVHQRFIRLQNKPPITDKGFATPVELLQMKHYILNNRYSRYISVKDRRLFAEIESWMNQCDGELRRRSFIKTNEQYQKLRTLLEELIHQRTGIERFVHFVFIGMWLKMGRWVRRSRARHSVK